MASKSWIATGLTIGLPLPSLKPEQTILATTPDGAAVPAAGSAPTEVASGVVAPEESPANELSPSLQATKGKQAEKKPVSRPGSPPRVAFLAAKPKSAAAANSPPPPPVPSKLAATRSPAKSRSPADRTATAAGPRLVSTSAGGPRPAAATARASTGTTTVVTAAAATAAAPAAPLETRAGDASTFSLGDRVIVIKSGHKGIVRFVGDVKFSEGSWVGVELELALGKNDGSVQGRKYFHCASGHGIFVKAEMLQKAAAARTNSKARPLSAGAAASPVGAASVGAALQPGA